MVELSSYSPLSKLSPPARDTVRNAIIGLAGLALLGLLCARGDYYMSPLAVFAIEGSFLTAGIAALSIIGRKKEYRPHWCFLAIWTIFGIMSIVLIPPNYTPDYMTHFYRMYEISEGHLLSQAQMNPVAQVYEWTLPASLDPPGLAYLGDLREVIENFGYAIDPEATKKYYFASAALYSPVTYLPGVVGMLIAKPFTANAWILMYASRISTWAICGAMFFLAIRAIPVAKPLLAITALLPCCIFNGTSTPSDIFTIAVIFCLFAYVFWLRGNNERASLPLLFALTLSVSLVKVIYLPVCLIVLLIPKSAFPGRCGKPVVIAVLAGSATAASLIWMTSASQFLIEIKEGVDASAQLNLICEKPLDYLVCMAHTVYDGFIDWVLTIWGRSSVGAFAPLSLALFIGMLNLYLCVRSRIGKDAPACVTGWERALLLAVFLIISILTLTSLYLQWTPVGNPTVIGVQGRYFISVIPFLVVGLLPRDNNWMPKQSWAICALLSALIVAHITEMAL